MEIEAPLFPGLLPMNHCIQTAQKRRLKKCQQWFLWPCSCLHQQSWELSWRPMHLYDFIMNNPWFPITCCALYLVGIYGGQKYMANRPPYVMKRALAAWNLSLAILSFFGLVRGIPPLIHNFMTYGFESFLCNDPQNSIGQSATAVWGIFFVLSKPA